MSITHTRATRLARKGSPGSRYTPVSLFERDRRNIPAPDDRCCGHTYGRHGNFDNSSSAIPRTFDGWPGDALASASDGSTAGNSGNFLRCNTDILCKLEIYRLFNLISGDPLYCSDVCRKLASSHPTKGFCSRRSLGYCSWHISCPSQSRPNQRDSFLP